MHCSHFRPPEISYLAGPAGFHLLPFSEGFWLRLGCGFCQDFAVAELVSRESVLGLSEVLRASVPSFPATSIVNPATCVAD
jgi:hypothetical protein